jgi:Fur family ferric uptake transcriptional regulator
MHPSEHNLTAKSIKPTAMRLMVLEHLLQHQSAVSLADLEACFPRADRSSIYRTLKTFEEHGLIHAIDDGSGAVKYALCDEACTQEAHEDSHVHFHCTRCGATFCLPGRPIPYVRVPEGYQVQEKNLVVKGICRECSS